MNKVNATEQKVNDTFLELKKRIDKIKAKHHPTPTLNVINNVNNIHNINTTNNNHNSGVTNVISNQSNNSN